MPKRFLCVLFILIITGSFLFALEGKIVETGTYILEDALYSGECMDCVKLDSGEWCVRTIPDERKISFRELTDRTSLLRIADALAATLEELIERDDEANELWFSKYPFPEYIEIR